MYCRLSVQNFIYICSDLTFLLYNVYGFTFLLDQVYILPTFTTGHSQTYPNGHSTSSLATLHSSNIRDLGKHCKLQSRTRAKANAVFMHFERENCIQ